MVYFFLFAWVSGGLLVSSLGDYDKVLGTGFDISKVEIGKSILSKGSTVFKSIPPSCKLLQPDIGRSEESWSFFSNVQEMTKSFEVTAGLSPSFLSVISLRASLSGTFGKLVRSKKSVSGATHAYFIHTHKSYLDKNCLWELQFSDRFQRDFMALKGAVSNPHLSYSWRGYKHFLKKYGTHYVTEITYGASVTQYLTAKSSHHFTKRDFKVKACLDLAAPAQVGLVKVNSCGGLSRGKQERNDYSNMNDNLIVMGGTRSTRNRIVSTWKVRQNGNILNDIEKLLNEGRDHKVPVLYKFGSISDLLMIRFANTKFAKQAANFKSYVEGFLNFGCAYKRSKNIKLQMFELISSPPAVPRYACTVAPEGCTMNSDCKFRGKCKCRGDTCVQHNQSALSGKITAGFSSSSKGQGSINKYCKWSWRSWKCKCSRPSYANERRVTWKSEQKIVINMQEKRGQNNSK